MSRAALLSLFLGLPLSGCGDSDAPSTPPSSSPSPFGQPGKKDLEALTKAPLSGADVEKYLVLYPSIRKTKKTEDIRAAAAGQGLSFQEAMFLVARVNSAYIALQTKGASMPLGGNAADVEVVRPYEARIKAVMLAK